MPVLMVTSYWAMRLLNVPLPEYPAPFRLAPVLLLVFFIGAVGEEVGWSGYAIGPMQSRWEALNASILLVLTGAV